MPHKSVKTGHVFNVSKQTVPKMSTLLVQATVVLLLTVPEPDPSDWGDPLRTDPGALGTDPDTLKTRGTPRNMLKGNGTAHSHSRGVAVAAVSLPSPFTMDRPLLAMAISPRPVMGKPSVAPWPWDPPKGCRYVY